MRRKIGILSIAIMFVLSVSMHVALGADRDRYSEWSRYYNGVCFRYITSYIGMDVWSAYPDAVQFYNSGKSTAKINYRTTVCGPRLLFLEAGQHTERTALGKDESITEINVTYTGEAPGWSLEGTWRGTGYQSNNSSWSIELSVSGNSYSIKYPSLTCGGSWSLNGRESDSATFTEHITFGRNKCIDGGSITIRRIDTNQVKYTWVGGNPRQTATAELSR